MSRSPWRKSCREPGRGSAVSFDSRRGEGGGGVGCGMNGRTHCSGWESTTSSTTTSNLRTSTWTWRRGGSGSGSWVASTLTGGSTHTHTHTETIPPPPVGKDRVTRRRRNAPGSMRALAGIRRDVDAVLRCSLRPLRLPTRRGRHARDVLRIQASIVRKPKPCVGRGEWGAPNGPPDAGAV